jgi:hypothetical protein
MRLPPRRGLLPWSPNKKIFGEERFTLGEQLDDIEPKAEHRRESKAYRNNKKNKAKAAMPLVMTSALAL